MENQYFHFQCISALLFAPSSAINNALFPFGKLIFCVPRPPADPPLFPKNNFLKENQYFCFQCTSAPSVVPTGAIRIAFSCGKLILCVPKQPVDLPLLPKMCTFPKDIFAPSALALFRWPSLVPSTKFIFLQENNMCGPRLSNRPSSVQTSVHSPSGKYIFFVFL